MTSPVFSPPALSRRAFLGSGALLALAAPAIARDGSAEERFPAVARLIESYVGKRKVSGMIAAIGLAGGALKTVARGTEGFDDPDPLTLDSLFRIYSMTKPITGMAAMILVDEGKLGLDQPLGEILPKFARMQVQVTPDGSLTEVRPATRPITIRNLLTHTAGLPYAVVQTGPIRDALVARGLVGGRFSRIAVPGVAMGESPPSLAAFADRLAELPLVYEPGTRWSYSLGLDVLGRVIEVVAGQPFDRFLSERILGPCGMTSTGFRVPARAARRLTTNYLVMAGLPVPVDPGEASIFSEDPPFPLGGAGLVSSPRDYDRFLAMLAGEGRIGGKRVMSAAAVRLGTSNLLPASAALRNTRVTNWGFGAGGRAGIGPAAGTFGWTGAAGTIGFVDLAHGTRAGLYTQYSPSNAYHVQEEFPQALAADLKLPAAPLWANS